MPTSHDDLGPSPAQTGETMTVAPGEWEPLDDHGTQIYVYGDQSIDIAFRASDADDQIRQLDVARELISTVKTIAETWRDNPGAYPDGAADPLEQIATVLLGPRSRRAVSSTVDLRPIRIAANRYDGDPELHCFDHPNWVAEAAGMDLLSAVQRATEHFRGAHWVQPSEGAQA